MHLCIYFLEFYVSIKNTYKEFLLNFQTLNVKIKNVMHFKLQINLNILVIIIVLVVIILD